MNKMTADIIRRALERLRETTGATAELKGFPGKEEAADAQIDLHFKNKKTRLFATAKTEVKPYHIPEMVKLAKRFDPLMVIAERIYPAQRQALRENGIAYLDTAGNIFLEKGQTLLWMEGNKQDGTEKTRVNRAFTKTGLKTVFYFLLDEKTLGLPYRTLAAVTGVALGNIKYIIEGLTDAGFILPVNARKKLLKNKKALLERWMTGYQEILKPTLHLGNFRFWKPGQFEQWETLTAENIPLAWGGEAAAERLVNYLKPAALTLYTQELAPLASKWRLIPDRNGPLKMYKKFWTHAGWDDRQLTPPLLVYADLLTTGDPRCIETAMIIYEKYLRDEFEQR